MVDANTSVQHIGKGFSPEEMTQIEAGTFDDDIFADRLVEQLRAAPPLLEKQQMYAIEDNIRADQMRRVVLAVASMPGDELLQQTENDREFAVAVLQGGIFSEMDSVIERYKGLVSLLETVQVRLVISLSMREDMESVIEEGKAALFKD